LIPDLSYDAMVERQGDSDETYDVTVDGQHDV
jgi:hypothetical protein